MRNNATGLNFRSSSRIASGISAIISGAWTTFNFAGAGENNPFILNFSNADLLNNTQWQAYVAMFDMCKINRVYMEYFLRDNDIETAANHFFLYEMTLYDPDWRHRDVKDVTGAGMQATPTHKTRILKEAIIYKASLRPTFGLIQANNASSTTDRSVLVPARGIYWHDVQELNNPLYPVKSANAVLFNWANPNAAESNALSYRVRLDITFKGRKQNGI